MMHGTMPPKNEIMPRSTIEEIVGYRNRALALYAEAFDAIAIADAKIRAAAGVAARCSPGVNAYNYAHNDETKAFYKAVRLPEREHYLRTARKIVDINAWSFIIERTDLERLMDKQAKDQLRSQMAYVPDRVDGRGQLITGEEIEKGLPELTVENIYATLQQFAADAETIFRRGIANAFSKLDRRFRSHDGFKLGSRVILTYAFGDSGNLNYGSVRDTLIDIERVFAVLDGVPEAAFTSALRALEHYRRGGRGPRQSYVETDYFRIRGFKNGNAHLWFVRDDLVEKVNKLLAEHYGEVIGDGQTQDEDPFASVKTTPARYYGFFPTPSAAADSAMELFPLLREKDQPQLRIMEPSAGTGNLARRCITTPMDVDDSDHDWRRRDAEQYNARYRFDNLVDCVEIQPRLAADLEAEGIYNRVFCQDFLMLSPGTTGLYDRVLANPPHNRERDVDHVIHALRFLKPDGFLTAIMSAGTEFRETKKAIAFRDLMDKMGARWEDLPAGSFAESGTYVNTVIVRVWNDGRRQWR